MRSASRPSTHSRGAIITTHPLLHAVSCELLLSTSLLPTGFWMGCSISQHSLKSLSRLASGSCTIRDLHNPYRTPPFVPYRLIVSQPAFRTLKMMKRYLLMLPSQENGQTITLSLLSEVETTIAASQPLSSPTSFKIR